MREYQGEKNEPPKAPSRRMESGDLLGVNVGWDGKWYVPSGDWVGSEAEGVQELYLVRRVGRSVEAVDGGGEGDSWSGGNELEGALDPGLDLDLVDRRRPSSLSSVFSW